jgi:hypothetical protein
MVARATSRQTNPSLPERVVTRAYERDPVAAAAEYGAEFRTDVEGYVSLETIEACVGDFDEMLPASCKYRCFTDPAGGGGRDSFTAAIAHIADKRIVVDAVLEIRPPFNPENAIAEVAAMCSRYSVKSVTGDRFAGMFPTEGFKKLGIEYTPSEKPKTEIYKDSLPLLTSGRLLLPRHDRLIHQLASLERRSGRGGRDTIDHPPGANDDIANVVLGAADMLATRVGGSYNIDVLGGGFGYDHLDKPKRAEKETVEERREREREEDRQRYLAYVQSGGMLRPW